MPKADKAKSLIVVVEQSRPVPLRLYSNMLTAFNRDYLGLYKCELILEDVHHGSLIADIAQLAAGADQINHLYDFAKNIAAILASLPGKITVGALSPGNPPVSESKSAIKSVEAMVKVAAESGANISIRHKTSAGEETVVDLTQQQAQLFQDQPKPAKAKARAGIRVPRGSQNMQDLVANIEAVSRELLAGRSDQSDSLLALLVEIIKGLPDGQKELKKLSDRLKAEGNLTAANLLDS